MSGPDNAEVVVAEWADADYAERLGAWAALSAAAHGGEPDDAARVLRRETAGRMIAEARRRDGEGEVRRAFAALRKSRHPLTGSAELTLLGTATDGVAPFDGLLTWLTRTADRPIALDLHLPPALGTQLPALLEKHGFAVTQIAVRLPLAAHGASGTPGGCEDVDLHPVVPEELGFVRSCLAAAIRRGLAGAECRVDLDAWIACNLPLPPAPDTRCFVGSFQSVPVCHATGRLRMDEFVGERVIDVVDTFVLPEWKRRGLSRLVTAALLDAAVAEGCVSAHSSVVADGGHERLLEALGTAGWKETGRQWRRA